MTEREHAVSAAWTDWRRRVDLDEYEARFVGSTAHGEADLVESLGPRSVLDAGCGTGRFAIELHRRGLDVVGVDLDPDLLDRARRDEPGVRWEVADLATLDLGRTFDIVAMPGNVILFCDVADRPALVDRCAAHVAPGGALVAGFSLGGVGVPVVLTDYDAWCSAAGLALTDRWSTWERAPFDPSRDRYAVSVHRPT